MKKLATWMSFAAAALLIGGCGSEPDSATSYALLKPAPKLDGDPANGAVFATDVSFWETPLSQAEMDCFWESGVRHVVVGTQQENITREQLAMAVSRGMTVDAYVYLYWDTDMTAQLKQAFQRVSGLPIGRMWLDIEEDPKDRGANAVSAAIAQAATACQAQGGVECGIYTSPGFWQTYANDTNAFTNLPLWWAHYDQKTSLSTWSNDAFGGWAKPVGKQWATKPLCGVGGVDWDTMQVGASPTVVVDRSAPPDTGVAPPAPSGLWPADGAKLTDDYAKIMSELIPLATLYDLEVERFSGSTFISYYKWTNPNAFVKFFPSLPNSLYRFHVRAKNAHGWGDWSDWSLFEFGTYNGKWPSTAPAPEPAPDAGAPPEPPPPGVPGDLAPDGGALLSGSSVTLSCSTIQAATSYEFAIESQSGSGYVPYFTYSATTPARTFYPQIHGVFYRWRARAKVAGAFGNWSSYATFQLK
jgi:Glycosyl hydrolases family 25